MAISLKTIPDNGKEKFEVSINNGHVDSLRNIVKKYESIKNEAQALDFVLKSVGNNEGKSSGIMMDGVLYTPSEYEE